jgi:large conductance mechanosensitive channel
MNEKFHTKKIESLVRDAAAKSRTFLFFHTKINFTMFKSLKSFLLRGDALSLAVGVVIGGAFNSIISTLVEKFFTPLLGAALGGLDFSKASFNMSGIEIGWGAIVQSFINFLLVGISLYLFLRAMGKNPNEAPLPTPSETLLTEIRDALKRN